MQRKKQKKKLTVKGRVELERRFLGSLLCEADSGDIREKVARFGISWRRFRDKRHRAIWRALEVLNLRSIDERMDVLKSEMDAVAAEEDKADPRRIDPEADPVKGQPGSAMAKQFRQKLVAGSIGLPWLERELDAAGACPVVGGKKYLRIIAEIGEGELLSPEHLAEDLFGMKFNESSVSFEQKEIIWKEYKEKFPDIEDDKVARILL